MYSPTTILVTGATGFIGRHLAARLVSDGYNVIGTYFRVLPRNAPEISGVKYVQLDLNDESSLRNLFSTRNIDSVFHTAAAGVSTQDEHLREIFSINTVGTGLLGNAALKAKVRSFIYLGSAFEYGSSNVPLTEESLVKPVNLYGASKAAGWMVLDTLYRLQGLPLMSIRVFTTYGPGEQKKKLVPYVIHNLLNHNPVLLTSGQQIRDYLFIDDLIEATIKVWSLNKPGEIFNVGGSQESAIQIRELVEQIVIMSGAPLNLCQFGDAQRTRHDPPYLVADVRKINNLTGWKANTPLEMGLHQTIQHVKQSMLIEL